MSLADTLLTRAGLLASLLAIGIGSSAVAQSPPPQASPLYAPDDLGFLLPSSINGIVLDGTAVTGEEWWQDAPDFKRAWMRDMLVSLGKEPSDVRWAWANSGELPDDQPTEHYTVHVMRVDGVSAEDLMYAYWRATLEDEGWEPLWARHPERYADLTVGQRTVHLPAKTVSTDEGGIEFTDEPWLQPWWSIDYFVGEVWVSASGQGGVTVDEALTELP